MPYAAMLTRYGLPDMLAWSWAAARAAGPAQAAAGGVVVLGSRTHRALDTDQSSRGPGVP